MAAEILHLHDAADRARAVDFVVAGEVVVCAFNGIFTLLGDADDVSVASKAAAAKGRSQEKGVALVCPPELFGEHVAFEPDAFARVQALQRSVHAVGVIVPASAGAPLHVVQRGTILDVWTEHQPLRALALELRRRGRRALAGTSANRTGEPTITDVDEVTAAFGDRVSAVVVEGFEHVPSERRRSASIVDLTGSQPRLVREGSVPAHELAAELRRLDLGELSVDADVRRV